MKQSTFLLIAAASAGCLVASCGDAKPVPADNLVEAYSEILIASNVHREDSVRREKILDSIALHFGFDDHENVLAEIHEITLDPEVLRTVLDSTQKRLQGLQEDLNAKGLK